MSIKATITEDCRYMSLAISGAQGQATVLIENPKEDQSETLQFTLPGSNQVFGTILSLQSLGAVKGIFRIKVTDSDGNIQYAAAFAKCDLICCIAKKVETILGCDCSCKKCNHDLLQAERVHLLISGIEADLSQIENDQSKNAAFYTTAEKKYNKALELCSDDCGCSC